MTESDVKVLDFRKETLVIYGPSHMTIFKYEMIVVLKYLFFISLICSAAGASQSGEVAPALARNRALEANDAVGETILGMKSSDGYIVMFGLSHAHKLQPHQASPLLMSRLEEGLAVGLVSLPLDKLRTTQMVRENVLTYFAETSETIPVGLLAVKLADEIHRRDRASAPLVFNALLVGQSTGESGEPTRKLLKVDQTANFFECDAVVVGHRASELNQWLLEHFSPQRVSGLAALVEAALSCLRSAKLGPSQCEICVAVPHKVGIMGPLLLKRLTLDSLLHRSGAADALCGLVEGQ